MACNNSGLIPLAVKEEEEVDANILAVGLYLKKEAKGHGRESLLFPGYQMELVTSVANASKGPVILVIMSGGGIDASFAKSLDHSSGHLWNI